jgi:uncharacterized small protein (TIGR04563 family)
VLASIAALHAAVSDAAPAASSFPTTSRSRPLRAEQVTADDRASGERERSTRMALTDKRKQSLYFPEEMLQEIQEEATRQDRSLSWIMQQAWRTARAQVAKMPGMDELGPSRRGS